MWIVWTQQFGILELGNYQDCLKEYEKQKEKYGQEEFEFLDESDIGEQIILAKVDKAFGHFKKPDGLFALEEHDGTDLEKSQ